MPRGLSGTRPNVGESTGFRACAGNPVAAKQHVVMHAVNAIRERLAISGAIRRETNLAFADATCLPNELATYVAINGMETLAFDSTFASPRA